MKKLTLFLLLAISFCSCGEATHESESTGNDSIQAEASAMTADPGVGAENFRLDTFSILQSARARSASSCALISMVAMAKLAFP